MVVFSQITDYRRGCSMSDLAMGGNASITLPKCALDIHLPQGIVIDVSALQLYSDNKVRGDGDMCFFNQPTIGAGAISLLVNDNVQRLSLDLAKVHSDIEKIVVNATLENDHFSSVDDVKITTSCGVNILVETSGRTEAALILCEVYKRNDQWKIRNVSQGFDGGLQALAEHFGVNVDAPAPTSAAPTAPSATSSSPSSNTPASTLASEQFPEPVTKPSPVPVSEPVSEQSPEPATSPTSTARSESASTISSTASGMFDRLKTTTQQARSKLSTEASRFKNRTFMEAVVNGCVLVAASDGSIGATEKQKMTGFIKLSDELKHFDIGEVISVFQNAAAACESDNILGKACALEKIRKVKTNEDQARLLVRVVSAIGAADGNFDLQEREMVTEIARELGLDPADFDI